MVKESITNPTDKIALPDRLATQLRNTPQLTRYDDESLLDLNSDNQHLIMEQLKQITLRQAVSTHTIHTHTVERAMNEDASMPQAPPPPPPPPAAASKLYQSAGSQTAPKFQTTSGAQTSPEPQMRNSGQAGPPPPPPAAGAAAAQTIDPRMDAHLQRQYEYAQAQMAHNESNHKLTREMLQKQMAEHLGPQGTTNVLQQQFITQVMQGKATSSAPPPADPVTTGGNHHPKPPPPPSGARIIASTVGAPRKPETYRIASRSRSVNTKPKPPQPPAPPDAPGVEAMTTETQQKRGRAKIGEEAIKVRRRITSKSAPPPTPSLPKAKAPPKIMETETQQKRFAKDEATGSGPTKKLAKAHEEVLALPKTESKKAAPPASSKPARITKPKAMKAAKPPPQAAAAAEVVTTPSPPKPPAPPPAIKKTLKKDKLDPASATLNVVIKELIKAKRNDLLTPAQTKEFEALVAKLKTKDGTAEVKSQMQAELRNIYRTKVFGK
jgi:hypothetical protein